MTVTGWLAAVAVGLLAGGLSGLVGIGGGAVMVPFLYFFLGHTELSGTNVSASHQAVVAHATSLLAIVPISMRGAWLYHRAGQVHWDTVWRLGGASVVTAVLGAHVAVVLPGGVLKVAFGIFLLVVAVRLSFGSDPLASSSQTDSAPDMMRALSGGAAVGFFSALLGVGGGLVAIPVLIYWLRVPIRKVSGTSLAIITFTALTGAIGYAIAGWGHDANPSGLLTFFHLPASAALAVSALVAVPLGAGLQPRIPAHRLRTLFAVVFLAVGVRIAIVNLLNLLSRP